MAKITAQQKQAAQESDRKKNKLERSLQKKLRQWHLQIVRAFSLSIVSGFPYFPLTQEERNSLSNILDAHYLKTVKVFSLIPSSLVSLKAVNPIVINQTQIEIAKSIKEMIKNDADNRRNRIIDTTEKEKKKSLGLAILALQEEQAQESLIVGAPVNNNVVAKVTGNILNSRLKNREEMLATTETTWGAEGTRQKHVNGTKEPIASQLEQESNALAVGNDQLAQNLADTVQALSDMTESETSHEAAAIATAALIDGRTARWLDVWANRVRKQQKMWITMGDSKVRQSHRNANGQRQTDEQPFAVGQSLLMYPGDGSLGAEIKEFVGCRCFVFYL